MNFRESISKEEVQQLPLVRFEGPIIEINDRASEKSALFELSKVFSLGFDTETKPAFVKGQYNQTAIIQLSTLEKAYLFKIHAYGFTDNLIHFLSNNDQTKVGISIKDDLKDLIKINGSFRPEGFSDLNDIAKDLGIQQIGMRSLSGIFLEQRVSKSQQTSNWENQNLSEAQKRYAATDAWICLKMYSNLAEKGFIY